MTSLEHFVSESARAAGARAVQDYLETFGPLAERCESPIEKRLLAALISEGGTGCIHHWGGFSFQVRDFKWDSRPVAPYDTVFFFCQAGIGRYRADFLLDVNTYDQRQTIVVECDGHAYHERTKEQAARDRSRDRWMVEKDITVLRYTGSEIVRDAVGCAEQICSVVSDIDLRRYQMSAS